MDLALTELCQELRNWFDRERYFGTFEIRDGGIFAGTDALPLQDGMYFRVIGSFFSDGVHKYPDLEMRSERFTGAVWLMAVPPPVIKLSEDIDAWRAKYEAPDAASMSPFFAESFGGYSYSKSVGAATGGGGNSASWKSAFSDRLNAYRKL